MKMLKKMKVNTIIIIGRGKCHGQLAGVHIHLNFIKNRDFLLIPWEMRKYKCYNSAKNKPNF